MGKFIDLTGKRFGRLQVIKLDHKEERNGQYRIMWLCQCDCGNKKLVNGAYLRNGKTTSCGCFHKEKFGDINRKHNMAHKLKLYGVWKSIRQRCNNPNDPSYKNYGGRGIKICKEWEEFPPFYEWSMTHGYKEEQSPCGKNKLSIDRIDVNGNYEPSNCRWATDKEQANNTRLNMTLEEKYTKCPVCNKTIIQHQRAKQETCSYKCMVILRSQRHFEQTKDMYKKKCPICGKIFEERGGHFKDRVTCSRKCANLNNSPVWEFNGKKLRVLEWAELIGINAHCLHHRREMGWTIEEILTTPIGKKRRVKCQSQ